MEKQFIKKITRIQHELKDKCILKATELDSYEDVAILQDAKGAKWNKYLHKHCSEYKFEIWKKLNNNFYVKAGAKCKLEAEEMGITPHTTNEFLRGKKRK